MKPMYEVQIKRSQFMVKHIKITGPLSEVPTRREHNEAARRQEISCIFIRSRGYMGEYTCKASSSFTPRISLHVNYTSIKMFEVKKNFLK